MMKFYLLQLALFILCRFMVIAAPVKNDTGFDVAIANSLTKVYADGSNIKNENFVKQVSLTIAGDESESFQLVIVPRGHHIEALKIKTTAVNQNAGLTVKGYRVGYVKTGSPSYPVAHAGLWPDPLLPLNTFEVKAAEVQPVWFTFTTTPNCKPGMYLYTIKVSSASYSTAVQIRVRVRNFTLPRPGKFSAPFGLYKNTLSLWYYGSANKLHDSIYLKWCDFLSAYRLTPKEIGTDLIQTININANGPKNTSIIAQNKLANLLKQYPPYSYGFYRLPSGSLIKKGLDDKAAWCTPEALAGTVIKQYHEWIAKGFPKETYVYGVDEPNDKEVYDLIAKTYKIIKAQIPVCKIMQTGNCNKQELIGLIDIWCPKTPIANSDFFKDRLKSGDILWDYICVSPIYPYPNFFIDEPAIDHRILFWQTKKINASGLLYWSTTHWQQPETTASANHNFPQSSFDMRHHFMYKNAWQHVNGDGMLLYPGPNMQPYPSIRLEMVRDGIEDFEYLALLNELIEKVKKIKKYEGAEGKSIIAAAKKLTAVPDYITKTMTDYTNNIDDITGRREKVGDMIEQLTDILTTKDYEKYWDYTMPTADK